MHLPVFICAFLKSGIIASPIARTYTVPFQSIRYDTLDGFGISVDWVVSRDMVNFSVDVGINVQL
jgi:hypothetical protein